MANHTLLSALHIILAESQELKLLYDLIGSDHHTKEYFMSNEADEEWEYQKEENDDLDDSDRMEWARDEEQFNKDAGYPNQHYFTSPDPVSSDTWLAHFTNADPQKIINKGFKGKDYYNLGLTSDSIMKAEDGPYAFAYLAEEIKGYFSHEFGKYGSNLILFKANEAIQTYHAGDEETQVIFVTDSAYDMHAVYGDKDDLILDPDSDHEFICDRNQSCVKDLIERIEKK